MPRSWAPSHPGRQPSCFAQRCTAGHRRERQGIRSAHRGYRLRGRAGRAYLPTRARECHEVLEWDTDDDDVFADVPSATRITHVSLVGGLGHRACVIRCADHRGITVSRRQKEVATLAEGCCPDPTRFGAARRGPTPQLRLRSDPELQKAMSRTERSRLCRSGAQRERVMPRGFRGNRAPCDQRSTSSPPAGGAPNTDAWGDRARSEGGQSGCATGGRSGCGHPGGHPPLRQRLVAAFVRVSLSGTRRPSCVG